MIDSFYIAWKYITYNKTRTFTLIACVTLISAVPLSLQLLLDESERQLKLRAQSTPLLVGAKGSSLDLVMNTLYFSDELPELISMQASEQIWDTELATAIPVYVRYTARGFPVVGTTLDYFGFRKLFIADGRNMAMLGECVVGATVAEKLQLHPGDDIVSSPETVFDIAGIYPLKMKVVGVLEKTHSSDDLAVFVDVKTAWVIEGLGHGHEDLSNTKDAGIIMDSSDTNVTAGAKLVQFTEISDKNVDSFHFHGAPDKYPLTAVITVPNDKKSGTILRGRYLNDTVTQQIVQPKEVIEGLLQNIFRIKNMLDAVILVVGFATVLAIVLVFALSLRLRQTEINTIFKMGCSRSTIAELLAAELAIIVAVSSVVCIVVMIAVNQYSHELVRTLFIR